MVQTRIPSLEKAPTGIKGLDEIVEGGLPRGRTTLICGGPGCGKTLMATEFLVRGAQEFGEPGVFMAFEETAEELAENVASLGIDLPRLIEEQKIFVDYVRVERSEIEETGEYDLEGLFIRLASAIEEVGAKRVVLDTIESIFAGFSSESILRSELRRLFRWMNDRGLTAVITGERGEKSLTRFGLEEYVSDCVILLENRVENKISNRILRVVKYRGSSHGANEYPFLIDKDGIWVQPITSLGLNYSVTEDIIPTGIPDLDKMLEARGFYRGSSILVSGAAGTGKTSLAATLIDAACARGERCLFFAFEEAPGQIMRNMRSIGIDLQPWVDQDLLRFIANRPTFQGLETHLLNIQKQITQFDPGLVIIDPLTNLVSIASESEVKSMLVRLIDFLKMRQITTLFTSLISGIKDGETNETGISSLIDVWLLMRNLEHNGERNRAIYILKARGMAHSSQVRELLLTDDGIRLVDVAIGPEGVLIGSARVAQEIDRKTQTTQRQIEIERKQRALERKRTTIESQISALQAEIATAEEELRQDLAQTNAQEQASTHAHQAAIDARQPGASSTQKEG